MRAKHVLLTALLALTALSGCLSTDSPGDVGGETPDESPYTPIENRNTLDFVTDTERSQTLQPGPFEILPALSETVAVDLPLTELGSAATGAVVHMGVFLPDVPAGTKVPIIVDAGPYYSTPGAAMASEGDVPATEPANRLGGFLIDTLVPHGFGVAQLSVSGTGLSNHCFDMMGLGEQLGIVAGIEHLTNADYSNGNIAMIGRSYDGSTPWQAAMYGLEGLKTIVPISGLTGIPELSFYQGSAELRTLLFHNVVYGTFAVDGDLGDIEAIACPDYLSATAFQTEEVLAQWVAGRNDYFEERSFMDRALQNYEGSVYLIHGLQDWNVDPHTVMPYYEQMQNRWETKALLGQWGHMYPDRVSEHDGLSSGRGAEAFPETVRMDWAQDLLEWFTYYLKEEGPKPQLVTEVQNNQGGWHVYDAFPPSASETVNLGLDAIGMGVVTPLTSVEFSFNDLTKDGPLHITGMPMLYATVTSVTGNGQLYALLEQVEEDGDVLRLGHGVMDVRFHRGGLNGEVVRPGETVLMNMQFEALDVVVPEGASLRLTISGDGLDESYATSNGGPLVLNGPESTFQIQTVPVAFGAFDAVTYTGPIEE